MVTSFSRLRQELARVIIGQNEIVELIIIAMLCRGHALLIGVPGLAKTLMVRSLGDILNLSFSRIQFTPDIMPTDITGTDVLEENRTTGEKSFRFLPGPLFANLILADEINRTPPKTQAALLEAMQEYQITAAGKKYQLQPPFFVLATQNPIEQEGTYPLPEAQLDRFMFSLWLDYPSFDEEVAIIEQTTREQQIELQPLIDQEQMIRFQNLVRRVPVARTITEYVVRLVKETRPDSQNQNGKKWIRWGAGPRAAQYILLGAKARALLNGRYTPEQEDVQALALPVLRHRIITTYAAEAEGMSIGMIIDDILKRIEK